MSLIIKGDMPKGCCWGGSDIRIERIYDYYEVLCCDCLSRTEEYSTNEEAIEAWNNRPSPWHTGTPTEEGDYLVQYKNSGHDVLHFADLSWFAFNRGGVEWQKIPDSSVIRWQKIEED